MDAWNKLAGLGQGQIGRDQPKNTYPYPMDTGNSVMYYYF